MPMVRSTAHDAKFRVAVVDIWSRSFVEFRATFRGALCPRSEQIAEKPSVYKLFAVR